MFFSFKPITPLYFVLYNKTRYIIDGLHRLNVYKHNKIFYEEKIPIVEIFAEKESDIELYFKLINDNMSLHDIYLNDTNVDVEMEDIDAKNNIIKEAHHYFIENYSNTFKYNGKRRPYLNNNIFIDKLEIIYNNKKEQIKKSNDLIKLILDLNIKYKKQDINWFPAKGKISNFNLLEIIKSNNCLYFGMLPNEWHLHLDYLPEYFSEEKISQSLRQKIWTQYSNNSLEIKCLCCNLNTINAFTFESGHIIPRANGGKCNINNLIPVCSLCNKSMSTTDMDIFMEKHNYNDNLKIIKKLKFKSNKYNNNGN
jgi:hypothetical protein